MKRTRLLRSGVAVAVAAALVGFYGLNEGYWPGRASAAAAAQGMAGALAGAAAAAATDTSGAQVPAQADAKGTRSGATAAPVPAVTAPDFAGIVERYGAAVVNIAVTGGSRPAAEREIPGLDPDDPMYEFFRRFGLPLPRGGGEQIVRGQGSGFIVSPDGMILTNAHVVSGAREVTVKLTDRREFPAKVVGIDPQTDVALIRIDAKNLPTVRVGDPGSTRVGDPVLAIGAPFGFENTATSGIVSAKSRMLPDGTWVPFIQTDVAVNPGNSGGPLFNARGEVIGINSQIYSRTGGYEGLSFAIPIDVAMKVQRQLAQHGKVVRGRMGVTIQEVDQALARSFGLSEPKGALVSGVEKGSPAEKAGLRPGDVIVSIDGAAISRSGELPARVADLGPGTTVRLEVVRSGSALRMPVTLGEHPEAPARAASDTADPARGRLGLAVRPATPAEAGADGGGLVIQSVRGPAAKAGLQPGDVIVALNGKPVKGVEDLRAMLAKAGRNVALLIRRDGAPIFVPLELGTA